MNPLELVPPWLLRPLPISARVDEKLIARIDDLAKTLPASFRQLLPELARIRKYNEYDQAANRAAAHVWHRLEELLAEPVQYKMMLLHFAQEHMAEQALARILRRLVRDPDTRVRARARQLVQRGVVREVALPARPDGDWDPTGWLRGTVNVPVSRHTSGAQVLERYGLPPIPTLSSLRKLLGIRSPAQLGWFLLASDAEDGPYTTFSIAKRDGQPRQICAPKSQLRWIQRQILDKILARVPAHDAAHGFVPGRSTVTNAAPHLGARVIVKFDLTDFFPTIHFQRVLGLFARLGYPVGNGRFGTDDRSRQVAPTLARLCCYTPTPATENTSTLPQGAPTSPAISNLVCRRLDARLTGLARRNQGTYTRYADDLTFSFREQPIDLGRFRWWVDQICFQEGFLINERKFRVIRSSQRQVVTGIVVNEDLRVPREERRRFRAILHNCRNHGVESQARGHPRFADYLRGFASYIHMVQPEEGVELMQEVEALLGPEDDQEEAS